MNGSRNDNLSDLKEVLSDGKGRRNSQKEFRFFLRSSGKSISKNKTQRERLKQRSEDNDHTNKSDIDHQRLKGRRHQLQRICIGGRNQRGFDLRADITEIQTDKGARRILYQSGRDILSSAIRPHQTTH